jgi:hypothetical protein
VVDRPIVQDDKFNDVVPEAQGSSSAVRGTGGSFAHFGVPGELDKHLESIDNNLSRLAGALEQLLQLLETK